MLNWDTITIMVGVSVAYGTKVYNPIKVVAGSITCLIFNLSSEVLESSLIVICQIVLRRSHKIL